MAGITLHKPYINPSAEHQESPNFICDLRASMCMWRTGPSAAVMWDWGKPLALKERASFIFCPSVSPFPVLSPFLSSYLHSFILSSFIPTFSVFPFTSLCFLLSYVLPSSFPCLQCPVPFYSGVVSLRGSCVGLCCWAHCWLLGKRQFCQLQEHSPFGSLAERLCKD